MVSNVTHYASSSTSPNPQTARVTAQALANPNPATFNSRFHTKQAEARTSNTVPPKHLAPFQTLGPSEWNHLSRFLLPRDIHKLSQTCTRMHAIGQQLLQNVNELSLAQAIASHPSGATFVNAAPIACLRLSGNCANIAAHCLSPAPNVTLLDMRGLQDARAPEIIRLAHLHPNARILLNAAQKTDLAHALMALTSELLPRSSDQAATPVQHNPSANIGTSLQAPQHRDPLRPAIDSVPANLLTALALEACAQSVRHSNEDSTNFSPLIEELQTQRFARLASSLLERCQREGMLGDPARLYLAMEGIRRFEWNVPAPKSQHLLLLSKLALALEGPRIHNSMICQSILSALAVVLDTEFCISRLPNRGTPEECKWHQEKVSPQQLLGMLVSWGLEPMRRNNWHENVFDKLEARGLRQPAHLLRQATTEALILYSAQQTAASAADLAQCTVS